MFVTARSSDQLFLRLDRSENFGYLCLEQVRGEHSLAARPVILEFPNSANATLHHSATKWRSSIYSPLGQVIAQLAEHHVRIG
jgi:hypothetical protein